MEHILIDNHQISPFFQELNAFRRKQDTALVIQGNSLEVCLEYYEHELMELIALAPAVVACRSVYNDKGYLIPMLGTHC